jgi:hypothetical protein
MIPTLQKKNKRKHHNAFEIREIRDLTFRDISNYDDNHRKRSRNANSCCGVKIILRAKFSTKSKRGF